MGWPKKIERNEDSEEKVCEEPRSLLLSNQPWSITKVGCASVWLEVHDFMFLSASY